jgi:uncharacterized protein YjiS (DUF1127 family)
MAVRAIPSVTSSPPARRRGWLDLLLTWHDTVRQRRALRALDDRMLRDIGLSRADVEREATRPFWDLPEQLWP